MMKNTSSLQIRTADGRLCHASYADEAEKLRIIAWAQANGAVVTPAAPQQQQQAQGQNWKVF